VPVSRADPTSSVSYSLLRHESSWGLAMRSFLDDFGLGPRSALVVIGVFALGTVLLVMGIARHEAYAQVKLGMTLPEVEALLGGEGQFQIVYSAGSLQYLNAHSYFKRRWGEGPLAMDVTFWWPRDRPVVVGIEGQPTTAAVWCVRASPLLLAGFYLKLILLGFFRALPRMYPKYPPFPPPA